MSGSSRSIRRNTNTNKALAEITDEGLFERVATAVLRIAEPLCATLSHPGVNADGKTRKAPLDGIGFVRGADPPHLVAVHHTTTAAKDLENKWLHDPATVKPRKPGGKPTTPAGDLVKTAAIVAEERVRTPGLRATLILTTNEEPGETLVRAVSAAGAAHRIEVDIWSRSRLAHVLDTDPTGQWVRRTLLDIEQELLSEDLLGQLSRASLDVFKPHDDPRAWVPRQLDRVLRSVRRPINFIVAESGLGKSVACYRALTEYIDGGGYGLILTHDEIAQTSSLDQAVIEALHRLHPVLASGQSPLAFCSPDKPLMVVVEDINRFGQPQRLAEKIAGWDATFGETQVRDAKPWRLFCPIWPGALALVSDQTRKLLEPMLIVPEPMTPAEGTQAVIARASLIGRTISEVTAEAIATALGHDPLLIALHDIGRAPDPHLVLSRFIEGTLQRAQASGDTLSAEFRAALLDLAGQMLERRKVELSWSEISSWSLAPETLPLVKRLSQQKELLRPGGASTDLRLLFRHDRVRDSLLVEAASGMDEENCLGDEIVGEPYFAEVLGTVIVRRVAPAALLDRARRLNPLALFHALRVCAQGLERARIVQMIEDWLGVPANLGSAYSHLRWEGLAALEATEGPEVPGLVQRFPDRTIAGQLARLRNGDISGGIEVCLTSKPGVRDPIRDRHFEHAKLRFGGQLIKTLDQLLRRHDLDGASRVGLLRFAGHIGEASLGAAIDACWSVDTTREERLADYLWAFARCCEPVIAAQYLDPVCAAWAARPDRDSLAAEHVCWAFERALPLGAIDYFIARARQPDLRWPITYMFHRLDDPRVMTFIVAELGPMRARADASGSFVPFSDVATDHWHRAQEEGHPMSPSSRDLLLRIWQDHTVDVQQRIAAFDIWAATQDTGDIQALQNATADTELTNRILSQRLDRGDSSAVPALIKKLRDHEHGYGWWFFARHVWSPELTQALDEALTWRRDHVAQGWGQEIEEDGRTQEMIMRLPVAEAERLLLKHWTHLRFSRHFVQALYVATPELCRQAAGSVKEAPDPASLFRHISQNWGIATFGHPGVTRERQVLALETYLGLIAVSDLNSFADACNRLGWFDLRRRLLDARIDNRRFAWSPKDASAHFDALLTKGRHYWIDLEIRDALNTGASWDEYLGAMRTWFEDRQSFVALQLMATAIAYKGSRRDLSTLRIYEGMPRKGAEALITDVTFAVHRRTPD